MRWACVLVFVLGCSSKQPTTTSGSGTAAPAGCDGARQRIEQLYRAEATAANEEPDRVEESIADNTAMVMAECAKSPDQVVACVDRASTAAALEQQCLAPLDDEGTEGEALRK